ncbi:unnamed protein product [Dicrocoelium dendriticum]|nr:unnamed protein product [Dicrocoelium dendriticum]
MPGHNLHWHGDLSAPFSRIPGNPNICPVEFWNPLVNLMPPLGHHSALLNTTTATTEPPGPTCPESTLSALLLFPSSSSSSVASAAGSTVTVVSSGYDSAGLLEKQTSLTNGVHGPKAILRSSKCSTLMIP